MSDRVVSVVDAKRDGMVVITIGGKAHRVREEVARPIQLELNKQL